MKTWQPTPVFLPGEFHGQRSLVAYHPWGCQESYTTERLTWTWTWTRSGGRTSVGWNNHFILSPVQGQQWGKYCYVNPWVWYYPLCSFFTHLTPIKNLFIKLFKLPNLNEPSVYCCDLTETGTDETKFFVRILIWQWWIDHVERKETDYVNTDKNSNEGTNHMVSEKIQMIQEIT